jgi:gas vesicle protein
MKNVVTKKSVRNWVRLAAQLGVVLTDPKVRSAIGEGLKDRVDNMTDAVTSRYDDMTDTVASKYEDAADRFEAAAAALQGKRYWPSRVSGFLLGVGVGAGLGILLAPASGLETREAVRGKAVDMKNKIANSAAAATERIRQSVTRMPSTGTEG